MGAVAANRLPAAERVLGLQENEAVTLSLRDVSRRNKQLLEDQAAANEALEVIQLLSLKVLRHGSGRHAQLSRDGEVQMPRTVVKNMPAVLAWEQASAAVLRGQLFEWLWTDWGAGCLGGWVLEY